MSKAASANPLVEKEKSKFSFGPTVYTAIVTTIFTVIGSLSIAYLNQQKSTLQYEILPISSFKADSAQLTIINIRIVNSGNKECENVAFAPTFGDSTNVSHYTFQKSSLPIQVTPIYDSSRHQTYYSIPYLNPNEQLICSFLFKRIVNLGEIAVDLRSKGATGTQIENPQEPEISKLLFFATIGMLALTIGLIVFIIFHQRKIIKHLLFFQATSRDKIKALKRVLSNQGLDAARIEAEMKAAAEALEAEAGKDLS